MTDVLTGYAPNNFASTSAEFGPASVPSLDPDGGLQHAFLAKKFTAQIDDLAVLGASTSLADHRSATLVYVLLNAQWVSGRRLVRSQCG